MNLLIDVGNTSTKLCVYQPNSGFHRVDFAWVEENLAAIEQVAFARVRNSELLDTILSLLTQNDITAREVSVTKQAFSVECAYTNYSTLGVDRWLGIVAAESLYPNSDVIVVDAGTAMTVDVLSASKRHLGGWITPGLALMQQSIVDKAPGVFSHESLHYENFGTSTPSALYSGCINCLCGAIEKARSYLSKIEFHAIDDLKVVMAGGDAHILAEHIDMQVQVEPNLVFMGLNRFLMETL